MVPSALRGCVRGSLRGLPPAPVKGGFPERPSGSSWFLAVRRPLLFPFNAWPCWSLDSGLGQVGVCGVFGPSVHSLAGTAAWGRLGAEVWAQVPPRTPVAPLCLHTAGGSGWGRAGAGGVLGPSQGSGQEFTLETGQA